MKYLCLDIETTGLDEEYCQILEIAGVLEDTKNREPIEDLPCFNFYIYRDVFKGDAFALHMNAEILKRIDSRVPGYTYIHENSAFYAISDFLQRNLCPPKISLCGKNVGTFDLRFLRKLPRWNENIFHRRVLDPAMYFWSPEYDSELPDTKLCASRADINIKNQHHALNDCRLVIELMRIGINRCGL